MKKGKSRRRRRGIKRRRRGGAGGRKGRGRRKRRKKESLVHTPVESGALLTVQDSKWSNKLRPSPPRVLLLCGSFCPPPPIKNHGSQRQSLVKRKGTIYSKIIQG